MHVLVASIKTTTRGSKVRTRSQVELPARAITILNAKVDIMKIGEEHQYDVQFNIL